MYIAMNGMVKVVSTRRRDIAATNTSERNIGMIAWMMASNGPPFVFVDRVC
jgi:hypothetical protein